MAKNCRTRFTKKLTFYLQSKCRQISINEIFRILFSLFFIQFEYFVPLLFKMTKIEYILKMAHFIKKKKKTLACGRVVCTHNSQFTVLQRFQQNLVQTTYRKSFLPFQGARESWQWECDLPSMDCQSARTLRTSIWRFA